MGVIRVARAHPSAALGGVLVLLCVALALASPAVHDAAYNDDLTNRLQPPIWFGGSSAHLLGTDSLGRDVLARIMTGLATSLLIAVTSVCVAGAVGVAAGIVAGYVGGWLDDLLMRVADAVLAIPLVLLAIAVLAVLGPGTSKLVAVIAFTQWMTYARTVRGETMVLKEQPFMLASRAIGAPTWWALLRHVLPHVLPSGVVLATLNLSAVVLLEAGLSYLGLGVPPPNPSLGSMLTEGQQYVSRAPWLAILPGSALFLLVLGANLVGEGVRAALDPHSRGEMGKAL
jgi:peptide/nickel transport system permease protein